MSERAERREGTKESGLRHGSIASRLSSFLSSCLSRLRWEMLMITVKRYNYQHERTRKKYCAKGFHKFINQSYSVSYQGKTKAVEYIGCPFCNFKFFSTMKDKRKYLALTHTHKSVRKKAWKGVR